MTKTLKLKSDICWVCGEKFDNRTLEKKETEHHGICKRLEPKFNIKIPVCQSCHYLINNDDRIIGCLNKIHDQINQLQGVMTEEQVAEEIDLNKELGIAK